MASRAYAGSADTSRVRRVAALSDVHGNVFALRATLADVRAARADTVVFCGDLAWGTFPREALELLRDPGLPALYVRGNADREVAAPEGESWEAEVSRWCAAQLDDEHRAFLAAQPETVTLDVERLGKVLFCHGSPRGDEEKLTFLTPEARLREAVGGVTANVVVCGHTHMQFDRSCGGVRVVNAGSVGMPYEGTAGAYWCLLDSTGVTLRRTEYDFAAAADAIRGSGCPYAAEFAQDLLTPPGREETAALFEGS